MTSSVTCYITSASDELVAGSSDVPGEVLQIAIEAGRLAAAGRHERAAQFHDGGHVARRQSLVVDSRCPDVIGGDVIGDDVIGGDVIGGDVIGCRGDWCEALAAAVGEAVVGQPTQVPRDVVSPVHTADADATQPSS